MAKRISHSSNQLRGDQKAKLAELLSAKDSHGRPKMNDPSYAADVRRAIAGVVGHGKYHEEIRLKDNAHDLDRKIAALEGLELHQKQQAKENEELLKAL